jgi:hypothetical protein
MMMMMMTTTTTFLYLQNWKSGLRSLRILNYLSCLS